MPRLKFLQKFLLIPVTYFVIRQQVMEVNKKISSFDVFVKRDNGKNVEISIEVKYFFNPLKDLLDEMLHGKKM